LQEINNGGLSQAPPPEPSPLQDMSPNVPLLSLSQCISPETKLLGSSPNVARRLSFSAAVPAAAGGFSLQDPTTTTSNKLKDNQLKVDDDGISPLLARIAPPPGCPWVAEFGELADLSKLGSLPSEDDILLKFAEHSAKEEITTGSELHQHPQKQQQQQEYYLKQPCSYFQREQQPIQQHQEHQTWVPHQSYEKDFAGTPTPLFTQVNDRLRQQQHHMHSSTLQPECQDTGDYPPTSSSSFNHGNVPPWSAATTAAYYSRSKRKAESDLGPATAPPSSVAASRCQSNKQQRQNGRYSGHYSTTFPLSGYQQQPSRNRTTTNARNKSTHSKSSALPDDFESDDPGANTGRTYRGVSRHRLTQRWEASLWLNGRQLYLGGFDAQVDAAKAYDIAALACKGRDAIINFSAEEYDQQLREIAGFSREEVVAYVRRRSAAFSRGKSKYRGVSGHNGRWEARIGSFNGRKNVSFADDKIKMKSFLHLCGMRQRNIGGRDLNYFNLVFMFIGIIWCL